EPAGGLVQPLGMLGAFEDFAAVSALALEHAAGVVQPVREHVQFGVFPRHELAVVPDNPVSLVEGQGHAAPPATLSRDGCRRRPFALRAQAPCGSAGPRTPRFATRRNGHRGIARARSFREDACTGNTLTEIRQYG